ncbi:RutC family protein YjgH 1 [Seiridium cupressi]
MLVLASSPVRTTGTVKLSEWGTESRFRVKVDGIQTRPPPVFPGEDVTAQIDQAFSNIDHTLKTAGGKGMSQVFRITSYHPSSSPEVMLEAMKSMKANLEKWFPHHRPIWTAVGVQRLAFKEMLVEIEAVAHDPR